MPPKRPNKQQQLRIHVENHDIKFEGPVPPSQWPDRYKHLFQVIHNIWSNRYDDYEKRTDVDARIKRSQCARVRDLRINASRLRVDVESNEDTWRGLIEVKVIGRFDQEIVW
jgi:hypothetical protein